MLSIILAECIHTDSIPLSVSLFKPVVTLDGVMTFTFSKEGSHTVTIQASVGNTVLQDQMTLAVYGALHLSVCLAVEISR